GMLLARTLRDAGVTTLFALPGGHILSLLDACSHHGIRVIDTRHEGAAALAAEGWALATGDTGVCAVTAGPGFANGLIGLIDASAWSVPLLFISGRTALASQGRGAVMDIDQRAMVSPLAKWAASCPRTGAVPRYAAESLYRARSGCPGAVYLDVPWDVMDASAAVLDVAAPGFPSTAPRPAGTPEDIGAALAALRNAERPLIVAGSGVFWSDAGDELARFCESAHIPVITASAARGTVADSHEWCLGSLVHGGIAMPSADCVMVVGSAFNANVMFGSAPLFGAEQRIIQVDIDPARVGGNRTPDVAVTGDARHVLHDLRAAWRAGGEDGRGAWLQRARELAAASLGFWDRQIDEYTGSGVHAGAVARELADYTAARFGGDITLVADGGDALSWALAYFTAQKPGRLLSTTTALGTLGVGMPFALAAKAARPNEPVLLFTGDGSLGLTAMEIDTAVRHNLPLVVVVSNNAGWGDVRHEQDAAFGPNRHVASELNPTRYDLLAQALGARGEHVQRMDDLRPALQRAFDSGECTVIDVSTDPSVLSDLLRMVSSFGLM
ncbi:MAG TPA: thiamine pyrophosphate-binding protein, partial [Candidatus Dormibacteraeota bacterium]|nr:thiamine pyrophosphate-binding protein [Candidatus Dormibacteraeota bacterium]